eukprot:403359749
MLFSQQMTLESQIQTPSSNAMQSINDFTQDHQYDSRFSMLNSNNNGSDNSDQSMILDQNGNRFRRKRSERQKYKGNEYGQDLQKQKSSENLRNFIYQPQQNFDEQQLQRFDTKESTIKNDTARDLDTISQSIASNQFQQTQRTECLDMQQVQNTNRMNTQEDYEDQVDSNEELQYISEKHREKEFNRTDRFDLKDSVVNQNVLATDHSINQVLNEEEQLILLQRMSIANDPRSNFEHQFYKMSLKESPIKGTGNHNINLDLSFLQKDNPLTATPSAIIAQSNFSPDSPNSHLKNNHTPNHHRGMNQNYDLENIKSIDNQNRDFNVKAISNLNQDYQQLNQVMQPIQTVSPKNIENQANQVSNVQQQQPDIDKSYIIAQYDMILQQLNTQTQQLLIRNQELEQNQAQTDMVLSSQNKIITELQAQMMSEKMQQDQKLEQVLLQNISQKEVLEAEIEKHKQILQIYSQELELARQQSFELDQRLQLASQQQVATVRQDQENKIRFEELQGRVRHLETQLRLKEDEIFKLRQDNQNMYGDLRSITHTEEQYKVDILESRSKRQELEIHNQDLIEKSTILEQKIKSMNIEMEKLRRENASKSDQSRMHEQNMIDMRDENKMLRDKLANMEQDRINLQNEKERRDRDCKNMQSELNRMNSMIQTYKNMGSSNDFKPNSAQEVRGYFGKNNGQNSNEDNSQTNVSWINGSAGSNKQNYDRQALKNADMNSYGKNTSSFSDVANISWVHGQNSNNNMQQADQTNYGDYSPMKKSDPNVPYAQRQKMIKQQMNSPSINALYGGRQQQQPQQQQMYNQLNTSSNQGYQNNNNSNPQMHLQQLLQDKQKLESEYSKIPITINGKSLQIKKRKEELEFDLDVIEKSITKCMQKIRESGNY